LVRIKIKEKDWFIFSRNIGIVEETKLFIFFLNMVRLNFFLEFPSDYYEPGTKNDCKQLTE